MDGDAQAFFPTNIQADTSACMIPCWPSPPPRQLQFAAHTNLV